MHVLDELDKRLFDTLDKINQVELKTQKENFTLADLETVTKELKSINKEFKSIEEKRKQNNLIKQNQTKIVSKVLFYITGFLSFCSISTLLFPKFYPNFFLTISEIYLPSVVVGQYQSLVFSFFCCFIISLSIDSFERAGLLKLKSLKYKAFLFITLLIAIILLAPASWIVLLWPVLAKKYYKRNLKKSITQSEYA